MRNDPNRRQFEQELESGSQSWVREVVRSLPDDVPSLAWRSELNESLQASARRIRRQRVYGWLWKPSLGLAAATFLVVFLIARVPTRHTAGSSSEIEKALVNSYLNSKSSWELTGDGITAHEARESSSQDDPDWSNKGIGATL